MVKTQKLTTITQMIVAKPIQIAKVKVATAKRKIRKVKKRKKSRWRAWSVLLSTKRRIR